MEARGDANKRDLRVQQEYEVGKRARRDVRTQGVIRTLDLSVKSRLLYLAELRTRKA